MKAKKTLEKYFSESDRLKAIIDEQQGINIHRRGGDAMASWLARSTLHRGSRARALAGNPGQDMSQCLSPSTLGRVVRKPLNG